MNIVMFFAAPVSVCPATFLVVDVLELDRLTRKETSLCKSHLALVNLDTHADRSNRLQRDLHSIFLGRIILNIRGAISATDEWGEGDIMMAFELEEKSEEETWREQWESRIWDWIRHIC